MDSLDLKVSFCAVTRKMRKLAEPNTLRKKKRFMDYLLGTQASKRFSFQTTTFFRLNIKGNFVAKENNQDIFKVDIVQVILFEID